VGGIGVALWQSPTVQERIRNPMGISTRFELWKWNFELFQERPIFGVGWRRSEAFVHALLKERLPDPEQRKSVFVGHAHNNGIEMLSGTGLFGSLVWFLYVIFPLGIGYRYRRTPGFSSAVLWGAACAWIVFLLNGLTQVNFWEGKVMHQWAFALGVLLSSLKEMNSMAVHQSAEMVETTRSSELKVKG
jgi:O-antigen ligase